MTTLIVTKLQSSGTADYSVSEVDYQLEETLKEFSLYSPHIVPMVFRIESRTGYDVTGTASKLTDAVKGQFLAADVGKVVHNITDNTWAVVTAYDSTTVLSISADIMDANEEYRIYNKECWNKKQIYLGDVPENYQIDSVEYTIGNRRNFKRLDKVLEIDVDWVDDSDSTLDNLGNIDVLVRFQKPHVLCQLTDTVGSLAATAAIAATAISGSSLQAAGTIEVGEEFTVTGHKSVYVVASGTTIASNTAAWGIYPPLEAALGVASTAIIINFRATSLTPELEDIFADMCAGQLAINKAPKYINTVVLGAPNAWQNYAEWGERKYANALAKLRRNTPPKTNKRYPTD
jgi:hypothetical protein